MSPRKPISARTRRLRRALACALSISGVMLTTAGTGHADHYAPPAAVPELAPSTLDVRFAAGRRSIEKALATAHEVGDTERMRALGAFLRPDAASSTSTHAAMDAPSRSSATSPERSGSRCSSPEPTPRWRRSARVWAGRGTTDWTEDVPHVRIFGLGLGPDPVSPSFGARVFDAGSAGHSDYLEPGSTSLRNLTGIALGRTSDVTQH